MDGSSDDVAFLEHPTVPQRLLGGIDHDAGEEHRVGLGIDD